MGVERSEAACATRTQSKPASGPVRVSALHPGLRHLQPRLPADERRARLHAAAGPAADRRLYAGDVDGPVRRREHRARPSPPTSTGPTWWWSAACTCRRRRSTISPSARMRPARWSCWAALRPQPRPKCIRTSTISTSARWATPPTQIIALLDESVARPPARCGSRPRSGCRCSEFPIPAYDLIPLKSYLMLTLAVLERMPVPLRVLRHPQPLRPAAAPENAATDHRRARCHAPAEGASAGGLFRR